VRIAVLSIQIKCTSAHKSLGSWAGEDELKVSIIRDAVKKDIAGSSCASDLTLKRGTCQKSYLNTKKNDTGKARDFCA
jgi:hypothetical protein